MYSSTTVEAYIDWITIRLRLLCTRELYSMDEVRQSGWLPFSCHFSLHFYAQ